MEQCGRRGKAKDGGRVSPAMAYPLFPFGLPAPYPVKTRSWGSVVMSGWLEILPPGTWCGIELRHSPVLPTICLVVGDLAPQSGINRMGVASVPPA